MALNIKKIIANSLIELSGTIPLSKITITDIVTKSGIARQTFYNHFLDKNDLIYWIYKSTLYGAHKIVYNQGFFAYLCNLYKEAQKYGPFFKQACKIEGQNSLSQAIYMQTYNYYKNYIIQNYGEETINDELEFALDFNANGASGMYVKWATEGMPGDPVIQATYALRCMPKCIRQYLPLTDEEKG